MQTHCYQVAVVRWTDRDEMAEGIGEALTLLGHAPILFHYRQPIPHTADVLFSFGPFGDFLSIVRQLDGIAPARRPVGGHGPIPRRPPGELTRDRTQCHTAVV